MENEISRCGYVAIVGRPNVGKSTLLNRILSQKISITSRKPQTTRHRILGIKTLGCVQTIYVDTPGMHLKQHRALNRHMNKAAENTLYDVDVIMFVVDSLKWTEEDEWILKLLVKVSKPTLLVVNKSDIVFEKEQLLPHIKILSEKFNFDDIIPLSARKGTNVVTLETRLSRCLPEGPHLFPDTMSTDRGIGFRMTELIREKLIRTLGEELPYSTTVEIDSFKEGTLLYNVQAIIWVERVGQKSIVIGTAGARLKEIGTRARLDMEKLFGKKVHLQLWVKVRDGWSNDEGALANLGYIDLT